jgi:VWFA-related protein
MRHWDLKFVGLLGLSGLAFATASSGQTPPNGQAREVIKATSQTVLVDVVVGDRSGHPVPGLKKEDFAILEDGKPQPISYFEAHAGAPTLVGASRKLPEGMYSNFPTEVRSDVVNVVLLDSLNTPTQDQVVVRKEMISYLKSVPPGTRIAIFTLASHLRMVNGFTTDPTALLDTLSKPGRTEGIDLSPVLITPDEQQEQDKRQDQLLTTANVTDPNVSSGQKQAILSGINQMRQFVSDEGSFNDDLRVKMTLQALDQLGRYLSPLPGRKNLIWFSASFPIGVDPDFNQTDAYRMMRDYSLDVRATAQRLAAARVAVYPIDARRFFKNPIYAPSNGGASYLRNGYYHSEEADLAFDQVTKEHDTMDAIAEDTGGRAIYDTNDLKGAMAGVIQLGDRYYTLAYDPVKVKHDGRFHKITVKCDLPGYKLLYRHGYVVDDEKAAAARLKQVDKEQSTRAGSVFRDEMAPGGPPASEILFRIQTLAEEHQPSATDKLKGDNPKVQLPVTRYVFAYAVGIDRAQLTTTPDGLRHGLLLTMVIAYDQQGRPLNSVLNSEKLDLGPKVYANALRQGLPFYQELDIPPGDVTIRVGVYDVASGKMGALEFPLTVKPQVAVKQAPQK